MNQTINHYIGFKKTKSGYLYDDERAAHYLSHSESRECHRFMMDQYIFSSCFTPANSICEYKSAVFILIK